MEISKERIREFQREILSWYAAHQRDLPWRKNRDPYRILVSEVMLQQTQVSRVIPKYEAWFKLFPTEKDLASATTTAILHAWSGLGYNRRALYLQKAVKIVVADYNGVWPTEVNELQKLPGLGEYTAGAVACFAFDEQIAVIDTNIRKVISLSFFKGTPPNTKTLREVANTLLPHGKAYEWNQALMDYCSTVLKTERVPLQKQSTFKGSNRYYRGKLLKLLLSQQQIRKNEVAKLLDTSRQGEAWVSPIVDGLVKDGFVILRDDKIMLKESA